MAEAMTGEKLSVGPPYFNSVAGPLALIIAALLFFAPSLRWRRDRQPVWPRIAPGALLSAVALVATLFLAPEMTLLERLGLALGVGLVPASLQPLVGRSLRRTPLATWGMAVAHLGVAVALVGMASDSAFTQQKLVAARPGETVGVGPWLIEFKQMMPAAGSNWTALEAELRASRGTGVEVLRPQSRTFNTPPTTTAESAIATVWNGQLYTVLGEATDDGRWQLRLWWKPFVTLIWLGGILIAFGGMLSLIGRFAQGIRRRRLREDAEEAFA
jgi:cytochrome c-type biogenesis protein CcmF